MSIFAEDSCTICTEKATNPVKTKCCGYIYCRHCLRDAIQTTSSCPTCRHGLHIQGTIPLGGNNSYDDHQHSNNDKMLMMEPQEMTIVPVGGCNGDENSGRREPAEGDDDDREQSDPFAPPKVSPTHDMENAALVTKDFIEHARYWRAVELAAIHDNPSIHATFASSYKKVAVHPQWFHRSLLNRYKKTLQSLCEHNEQLRDIPVGLICGSIVKKAFKLTTDREINEHRDPVTNENALLMLMRVATSSPGQEDVVGLSLAILVDVGGTDDLVSLVAEVCDRMSRCGSAQHQGYNLVLQRAGRYLDALFAAIAPDGRVTAAPGETEEQLSRRQSSLLFTPASEAPAAMHGTNGNERAEREEEAQCDENVRNSPLTESLPPSITTRATGGGATHSSSTRDFATHLKRFHAVVEDYIADHKERAIASCLVQPARYYFHLLKDDHHERHVEPHGVNWLITSVNVGLGVVLPQTADLNDPHSLGICCVWGDHALTKKCFEKFSDPDNFGKAFEGITSLSKKEDILGQDTTDDARKASARKAPCPPSTFMEELQDDGKKSLRKRWKPVVKNFAHFFSTEFFVPKMLTVLNGETKPEHAGFRQLCRHLFAHFAMQHPEALPLRGDDDERPAEDFDEMCYKDDYYTELDVEAVTAFFIWTGVLREDCSRSKKKKKKKDMHHRTPEMVAPGAVQSGALFASSAEKSPLTRHQSDESGTDDDDGENNDVREVENERLHDDTRSGTNSLPPPPPENALTGHWDKLGEIEIDAEVYNDPENGGQPPTVVTRILTTLIYTAAMLTPVIVLFVFLMKALQLAGRDDVDVVPEIHNGSSVNARPHAEFENVFLLVLVFFAQLSTMNWVRDPSRTINQRFVKFLRVCFLGQIAAMAVLMYLATYSADLAIAKTINKAAPYAAECGRFSLPYANLEVTPATSNNGKAGFVVEFNQSPDVVQAWEFDENNVNVIDVGGSFGKIYAMSFNYSKLTSGRRRAIAEACLSRYNTSLTGSAPLSNTSKDSNKGIDPYAFQIAFAEGTKEDAIAAFKQIVNPSTTSSATAVGSSGDDEPKTIQFPLVRDTFSFATARAPASDLMLPVSYARLVKRGYNATLVFTSTHRETPLNEEALNSKVTMFGTIVVALLFFPFTFVVQWVRVMFFKA